MGKNRQGCEKFIILQRHSALAEMYASHVSKAASGQIPRASRRLRARPRRRSARRRGGCKR